MNAVLTFKPDGIVTGLYTEAIPLDDIGVLEIHRITEIVFNRGTQKWEVKDMEQKVLFRNRSRQRCLDWEHRHFNQ